MPTRTNGPTVADINRMLKAAKWRDVIVEYPNGTKLIIRGDRAAETPVPPALSPFPISAPPRLRKNPDWDRVVNNPERMKLVLRWGDLSHEMWKMKYDAPPQPNGRATTMAQLRQSSPEFLRLAEERDALASKIGPDPPEFLVDEEPPTKVREVKLRW